MNALQKTQLRLSEIRAKLAEIAGTGGDLSDEQKKEMASLRTEYVDVETRHAALLVAEPEKPEKPEPIPHDDGDGEAKELRQLREKVEFAPYLKAALERRAISDGPEAEYCAALEIPADRFPLEMMAPEAPPAPVAPPHEERAKIDGDAASSQASWIERLFAGTAAAQLGVTMPTVGAGIASYPVISSNADPKQRGRTEAATAATISATVTEVRPTRSAVTATYSVEDDARLPGLADVIRRDLAAAMTEKVDRTIFLGDSGANEDSADISGFVTGSSVDELTLTQANKVKGAETLALYAALIDGKHAVSMGDLNLVLSVGSNTLYLSTQPTTNRNETLAQILRDNGLNWTVRGEIDTATANGDFGGFVGLARGITNAAVAPLWESAQMIVDPFSGGAKGEIILSLNYLWGFQIPRKSNFRRIKYVT